MKSRLHSFTGETGRSPIFNPSRKMAIPILNRFLPALAIWCLLPLASCGPAKKSDPAPDKNPAKKSDSGPEKNSADPQTNASDSLSKEIEAFTGGHTKAVWARYTGKASDVFANYDRLQLWGIDTRDGRGVRPIREDLSNYARPLILPDGSGIVFSNKGTTQDKKSKKKLFEPMIKRVDWNGGNLADLGRGYAVDVWRDPKTGTDWVYVTDLVGTERSSIEGTKLERFPLAEPEKRELVWEKTRISTENVQLSRDGDRASCLFPWPEAGVLNLETNTHQKYQHGCWPSMAPDSSLHAWVFDGAHKTLFMYTDGAADHWTVPVNTAPGIGKHEMYHPRWSNHVRYLSITGPYTGATPTRSDAEIVEVLVGRFSPDLKKIEDWLQITNDKAGDFFPDLWIAGGELASVERPKTTPVAEKAAQSKTWPVGGGPWLFLWENRDSKNAIDAAGTRASSVEAKGRARFGPHFEMLTDGGHFELDTASGEALIWHAGKPFTIELVARPFSAEGVGAVFSGNDLTIAQKEGRWVYAAGDMSGSIGPADPARASHLAVVFDGNAHHAYLDGKPAVGEEPVTLEKGNTNVFGSGWSGSIEGVALSAAAAKPEMIAASHAHWEKVLASRKPIPTVRVRGKLVEITANRPVEALDTYHRALLGYLYEVEEVLEGELAETQIAVMHWTILDRQPLAGFPREIGKTYELTLQPYAAHPELISERQWNDLLDPLEPWYDIATPGGG
jgi:hypothetical protein